jgi:hypothetical protein
VTAADLSQVLRALKAGDKDTAEQAFLATLAKEADNWTCSPSAA